jgi:hypothetical protein
LPQLISGPLGRNTAITNSAIKQQFQSDNYETQILSLDMPTSIFRNRPEMDITHVRFK